MLALVVPPLLAVEPMAPVGTVRPVGTGFTGRSAEGWGCQLAVGLATASIQTVLLPQVQTGAVGADAPRLLAEVGRVSPVPAALAQRDPSTDLSGGNGGRDAVDHHAVPTFTTAGPCRPQLFAYLGTTELLAFDMGALVLFINAALRKQNMSLVVLTVSPAYAGLALATNQVPMEAETGIMAAAIAERLGPNKAPQVSVGAPTSTVLCSFQHPRIPEV